MEASGSIVITRSESMDPDAWQESLLEPLMTQLRSLKDAARPDSLFADRLSVLRDQIDAPKGEDEDEQSAEVRAYSSSKQVLLACLALLESHLRTEMDTAQDTKPNVSHASVQGKISRMRKHFGKDFGVVIKAIQLRHASCSSSMCRPKKYRRAHAKSTPLLRKEFLSCLSESSLTPNMPTAGIRTRRLPGSPMRCCNCTS